MADFSDLRKLLGDKGILSGDDDMAPHLDDLSGSPVSDVLAVARPKTVHDVAATVAWCGANNVAIVPQGGRTGMCGGAVPVAQKSALILSLSRLNKVRDLDVFGNTVTVEAGAVLADVKAAAVAAGRYFPLSHGGEGSSQIGGNLSTNSGGNNAIRYGTARDQVLGLEVVLPDGTIWSGLRGLRKNTAGYDLKHWFIGAEGTLGIITAAVLKLRPLPKARATAFLAVNDPAGALDFLRRCEAHVGETITAFELLSNEALDHALTIEGTRFPFAGKNKWYLLAELESATARFDLTGAFEDSLAEGFESGVVVDAVIAQNEQHRKDFWKLREAVAAALIENENCIKSDTAVPVNAVPDYIANVKSAVEDVLPGVMSVPFGHLGDGNVHYNLVKPDHISRASFVAAWPKLVEVIEEQALKLGGTISAEHGIGRLKRTDFERFSNVRERDLMLALKRALDPDGIMNPGALLAEG